MIASARQRSPPLRVRSATFAKARLQIGDLPIAQLATFTTASGPSSSRSRMWEKAATPGQPVRARAL